MPSPKPSSGPSSGLNPEPYPLLLEPILLEKVWGGRRLERFGKALPAGVMIGESWELADLAATSLSGAGGGAQRSIVANGPLAGEAVGDALRTLGDPTAGGEGGFPLLVKLLDARENLSVQVHPSRGYAASHPEAHLKTECWYVLDAEQGSLIYKGVKPGVCAAEFREAIENGTVADVLESVPAIVGEMHELPSGTVHALGAGVLVAEVQTPSDTTFRVFDWGRTERELHIEQALACIDFGPAPAARTAADGLLCANEFFKLTESRAATGSSRRCFERAAVVMAIAGTEIAVSSKSGRFDTLRLMTGSTAVIPATCAADADLELRPGSAYLVAEVR
ncbi:MAG: type I phosphomannose isomerase catalytic subunit [Planctomycetota bacterium]